jgi:16S rRNA (adenine1518-N6/adenine1519-N6)-dimethyltransferase
MTKPISSYHKTMETLKNHELKAKKHYGQNFIIDPSVVVKIANLADVKDKVVIEVGPGLGALTEQLALHASKVIAFEIDIDCVDILNEAFKDTNVTIVHQDFLEVSNQDIHNATHLIGNLPYYITTAILFHVIETLPQIECITIMVQKEVADRFNAKPKTKDYNALSIILQTLFEIKVLMKVNPKVFMPVPKVESTVLQLKRRNQLDYSEFFILVKTGFTQRRKTLVNNLKSILDIESMLIKLGYTKTVRAEELSIEEWYKLYEVIYANQSIR